MPLPLILGGLALGLGSAVAGGLEAQAQRRRIRGIARTPGLDVRALTREAVEGMRAGYGDAAGLVDLLNRYYARQLVEQMEAGLPGYAGLREAAIRGVRADLAGELSPEVEQAIFRAGAGRALMAGMAGSPMHRGLVARDIGLVSDTLRQRGRAGLLQLVGGLPMPRAIDPFAAGLLGLTPTQLINLRSAERAQQMGLLQQAATMPGLATPLAQFGSQLGGTLAGMGTYRMLMPRGGMGMGVGMGQTPVVPEFPAASLISPLSPWG